MKVQSVMQARPGIKGASWTRIAVLFSTVALLLSPLSVHAADTVKVKAAVAAVEDLNPDYKGRPSPVNIIVFQLVAADTFSNADFFSLFEPEAAILGGDMIARTPIMLQPGESREWVAEFSKETRFVGVIAAYRDIENAQWRSTVALPKKGFISKFFKKSKLIITVDSLAVTVSTK